MNLHVFANVLLQDARFHMGLLILTNLCVEFDSENQGAQVTPTQHFYTLHGETRIPQIQETRTKTRYCSV
jgi:hypothetical protein